MGILFDESGECWLRGRDWGRVVAVVGAGLGGGHGGKHGSTGGVTYAQLKLPLLGPGLLLLVLAKLHEKGVAALVRLMSSWYWSMVLR